MISSTSWKTPSSYTSCPDNVFIISYTTWKYPVLTHLDCHQKLKQLSFGSCNSSWVQIWMIFSIEGNIWGRSYIPSGKPLGAIFNDIQYFFGEK